MSIKELIKDKEDDRLSHSKIGVILSGFIFCLKMSGVEHLLHLSMPSDPLLWLVFMATVGGYRALLTFINRKYSS